MKCQHDHENTPKFVKDALMTLKTLERVSDTMMEADVDVELLDIVYGAASNVLDLVCPMEVFEHHPELEDDEDFDAFIDHIVNHVPKRLREEKTEQDKLYDWCLEQASARFMGLLSQEQIDKLNSTDFPWAYYEEELDKLGYNWKKNNPKGVRYGTDTNTNQ